MTENQLMQCFVYILNSNLLLIQFIMTKINIIYL